ncbi:hypothetical protein ABK040_003513 [Willaertia magna]
MPKLSFEDVIKQQQSAPKPKQKKVGFIMKMLSGDRTSGRAGPTRQLGLFVPTLFACMMGVIYIIRSKLSIKYEINQDEEERKTTPSLGGGSITKLLKSEAKDEDEILLNYETKLWSNGYQNKAIPRGIGGTYDEDDDEDDDE